MATNKFLNYAGLQTFWAKIKKYVQDHVASLSGKVGGLATLDDKGLVPVEQLPDLPCDYVHPSHTAHSEGLHKVTVDALGHVTSVTAVTAEDVTPLVRAITDDEINSLA